ncbi:MAG: sugar transferase [Clostridia bacterium]|nr:sugar transferase [Clostridia bacterium]
MHVKMASVGGTAVLRGTEGMADFSVERNFEKVNSRGSITVKALTVNKKPHIVLKYINAFMKRIIDIIGGLVGMLLLIPATIIVAILNFVNKENGPIFYAQKRIGKNGKMFKMYKFRTMIVDADKKLEEILQNNEELRKEWEENRKLKNDPRITKIGNFLRKTSIDEIPQFVNVLIGNLSLVGPRAVVEDEIEKFGMYQREVLSVKPGITGYWAANGRSETSYEERVFMETKYAMNCSVWMDIKILFKTVISVVKKEGAM